MKFCKKFYVVDIRLFVDIRLDLIILNVKVFPQALLTLPEGLPCVTICKYLDNA